MFKIAISGELAHLLEIFVPQLRKYTNSSFLFYSMLIVSIFVAEQNLLH